MNELCNWDIFSGLGQFDGAAGKTDKGFVAESHGLRVETEEESGTAGVTLRRTVVRNVTDKPLTVTCLLNAFDFGGGEYEIYTQANTWMNESRGAWQPLHTEVAARGGGMRTSFGAAPMLALWNVQERRGHVFHLMSDAVWEMRASVIPGGSDKTFVRVEVGMDSRHLNRVLQPGEEVALPEVVHYDFANKTDLDCHRLHEWWNAEHPSRRCPSFYNTWLCRFDKLDLGFVLKQVECAKDLGLEHFVVDAGWFGPATGWTKTRGDWKESPDGRLGGRLADLSAAVRQAGMKFGFWLEAETADDGAEIVRGHPEFFRVLSGRHYLDFTREDAREYLLETVCGLIRQYGASFIKFDFNCDPRVDPSGRDFADYNAAYRRFIREVRERNPGIYLEGCASGGLMMDLGWADDFDSFWLSDNQSIVCGLRIAKETMLRLPPRKVERWLTVRSTEGLQPDYWGGDSRLLASEDGGWRDLRSLAPEYAAAFATGGPIGFSCDLTALSNEHRDFFRRMVAERKQDEAFWCNAVGRILCDTPDVVAIQYSDAALRDVRVVVATARPMQKSVTIRPVLDAALDYDHAGRRESGSFWMERGVEVETGLFTASEMRFATVKTQL